MKLVGLMACRNEDWCIGLTLRAALMGVLVDAEQAETAGRKGNLQRARASVAR